MEKSIENQLPIFDSLEDLAHFWDTHDLTDFEDELEEVIEPLFVREQGGEYTLHLSPSYVSKLEKLAIQQGVNPSVLIQEWVVEKLRVANE